MSAIATSLERLGPGVEVSTTSLAVTDATFTYERFESALAGCAAIGDSARWWLGDLLVFGEARYGEEYAQALHASRLSERQLNRYRYVCQQIARSRRRENLSFSHHEEVAPLEPTEQNALLRRAEEQGLSVAELREVVRDRRAAKGPRPKQEVLAPTSRSSADAVDAARGLSTARSTLSRLSEGLDDETADAAGITAAVAGIDTAAVVVRQSADVLALLEAVDAVIASAVKQTGIADPAYIVAALPVETLIERRTTIRTRRR
jgi:hypothetical protein